MPSERPVNNKSKTGAIESEVINPRQFFVSQKERFVLHWDVYYVIFVAKKYDIYNQTQGSFCLYLCLVSTTFW